MDSDTVTNEGTISGSEPEAGVALQTGEQVLAPSGAASNVPTPPAPTDLTAAATAMHTPIIEALEVWVKEHVFGTPAIAANTAIVNEINAHVGVLKTLIGKVWP